MRRSNWTLVITLLLLLTAAACGSSRSRSYTSDLDATGTARLPAGFLWGAATADQQIESRQPSDWTEFERRAEAQGWFSQRAVGVAEPGHIHNLGSWPPEVREKKANFDELFEQDLAMAAAMKHNAYRFSISWARLYPEEGMTEPDPAGVAFYDAVFESLARHQLKPVVTLFHFALPAWLGHEKDGKKGWERADALEHWDRFVRGVVSRWGSRVEVWCTLNEPMTYLFNGYLEGTFAPGERRSGPADLAPVMSALLKAHSRAYYQIHDAAKAAGRAVMVGQAAHTRAFEPMRNISPLDRITASAVAQAFIYDFMDAIHTGTLKITGTPYTEEISGLKGTQDYVGINYYGRFYLRSSVLHPTRFEVKMSDPRTDAGRTTDLGWALYPAGFYDILTQAHERYGLPIYVLENGVADAASDDRLRQHALVTHIQEIWNAIHYGGVDVRGYFHWSLTDNFEWAEGFEARFGLVEVDYAAGFARKPRPSAALYTAIIEEGGVTEDMRRRYVHLE